MNNIHPRSFIFNLKIKNLYKTRFKYNRLRQSINEPSESVRIHVEDFAALGVSGYLSLRKLLRSPRSINRSMEIFSWFLRFSSFFKWIGQWRSLVKNGGYFFFFSTTLLFRTCCVKSSTSFGSVLVRTSLGVPTTFGKYSFSFLNSTKCNFFSSAICWCVFCNEHVLQRYL